MDSSSGTESTGAVHCPGSVDLQPIFDRLELRTRPQGKRGTCSVFTVVGALEFALAQPEGIGTHLSVEFLNWAGHRVAGRSVDGGFFSELWDGYLEYGVCPETALPYQDTFDVDLQPSARVLAEAKKAHSTELEYHWLKEWDVTTGLTDEQFDTIKQTLAANLPVCGGFRWPKQAEWRDGVLQMCPASEVFDGHSVLLDGYRDDRNQPGGGVFAIRNSGGPSREGLLPYEYVQAYMNDAAYID